MLKKKTYEENGVKEKKKKSFFITERPGVSIGQGDGKGWLLRAKRNPDMETKRVSIEGTAASWSRRGMGCVGRLEPVGERYEVPAFVGTAVLPVKELLAVGKMQELDAVMLPEVDRGA